MTQVKVQKRVLTERSVQVEAKKQPGDRGSDREHVRVRDAIEFAEALKESQAPSDLSVHVVLVGGPSRILRLMRVDWTEEES